MFDREVKKENKENKANPRWLSRLMRSVVSVVVTAASYFNLVKLVKTMSSSLNKVKEMGKAVSRTARITKRGKDSVLKGIDAGEKARINGLAKLRQPTPEEMSQLEVLRKFSTKAGIAITQLIELVGSLQKAGLLPEAEAQLIKAKLEGNIVTEEKAQDQVKILQELQHKYSLFASRYKGAVLTAVLEQSKFHNDLKGALDKLKELVGVKLIVANKVVTNKAQSFITAEHAKQEQYTVENATKLMQQKRERKVRRKNRKARRNARKRFNQ